jgi:hypothetical protein
MASGKIRRVVTTAALTAVPVLFFAAPAAAQGSVPWHQSGAGGSLHQGSVPWHQSGAGGSLHQSGAGGSLHQIGAPWHQGGSGGAPNDVADAAVFDARF